MFCDFVTIDIISSVRQSRIKKHHRLYDLWSTLLTQGLYPDFRKTYRHGRPDAGQRSMPLTARQPSGSAHFHPSLTPSFRTAAPY